MEEKEQILTKLLKIHQINLYNYLFELLKSRIFLLKTEPVLHNIFEKKFRGLILADRQIRQTLRICQEDPQKIHKN